MGDFPRKEAARKPGPNCCPSKTVKRTFPSLKFLLLSSSDPSIFKEISKYRIQSRSKRSNLAIAGPTVLLQSVISSRDKRQLP